MFDILTKLFHSDSGPQLDTDRLAKIKDIWQVDIVAGGPNNPLKEQGVEIISEEISSGRKYGGGWRSTTKGRGGE